MKIAVLGAGNAGCAVAADLSLKGQHEVTLIKTSHAIHDDNFEYLREHGGEMILDEFGDRKAARIAGLSRDVSEISKAEVVIVYIQTTYHEALIEKIAPYLRDEQVLLLNPGYLSTAYVLRHCSSARPMIAEAESSFIDGRILRPGYFRVGFRNVRNPVGIYPRARRGEAIQRLERLGERLVFLDSVVEAALHNPNMIVHTVGSVMSIPRIELAKDDFCMYHEAYTRNNPATWRVLEALDAEKMNVLEALGFGRTSYVDACKFRNSLDDAIDAKEVFWRYAEMPTRAKGPVNVDSRYISEDVPQGLVLLETLGRALDVGTPVATALIEIAGAALGRDMRAEGRTLERLGIDHVRTIIADAKNG